MDDDWDKEDQDYATGKKRDFERDHEVERRTNGS